MRSKSLLKYLLFIIFAVLFALSFTAAYAQELNALFTKTLQIGATGEEVIKLQEFLKQLPNIYPEGYVTGYFGSLTQDAVIRFQIKEGIEPVGVVGPITRAKLNELTAINSNPIDSVQNVANAASLGTTTPGFPTRLKIPVIDVDAAIEYVGIMSDGAMDSPKKPYDVAWFYLGSRPGEEGSAVVSGHYGRWKTGGGSIFDNLYKLQKGDEIYVEDDNGAIITFIVRESRSYDPDADASNVFGSNDGKSHLNLVTCEGIWDKVSKSYSKRLVIFTDKK